MIKRFSAVLIFVGIFAATCFADENIRAVQSRLKDGGYYFGEVNGTVSSDLSAAITRYQIRKGLQITGNLNAETSKSLGVKAEAAAKPAPAPGADTWRRLRKTDQQFLSRATKPAPTPAKRAADSPTNVLEPAASDPSKVVLSPERLRDYVAAFVLAGLDPQVGAELEFFGNRVRYYNEGLVSHEKIRADLQRYDAQWPQRRFWLAGNVSAAPQPDSRIRVSFPLRYELRNGAKHSSGRIRKTLLLEVIGEDLQIVGVDETKA